MDHACYFPVSATPALNIQVTNKYAIFIEQEIIYFVPWSLAQCAHVNAHMQSFEGIASSYELFYCRCFCLRQGLFFDEALCVGFGHNFSFIKTLPVPYIRQRRC